MVDASEREAAGVWDGIWEQARRLGLRPTLLELGSCALDGGPARDPRHDLARFGPEVFRAAPRRGDLLIVAGPVPEKMAPFLRRLWDELPEPKWAMALDAGAVLPRTYAIRREIGDVLPVAVRVPGWPPSPDELYRGFQELETKIGPGAPG